MINSNLVSPWKKKVLDRLRLLGCALAVVVGGAGIFVLSDKYNVNEAWIIAGLISLIFFAIVGWPYRHRLKNLSFIAFFLFWLLVHLFVFFLIVGHLSLLYYLPVIPFELWIGYAVALRLFGRPL